MSGTIPLIHKERILRYLSEGKRLDGRALSDYRKIEITHGISKNAESAVSVKFGKTEVYAGVKMGVVEPYPDAPNEGTIMVSAELHPMASHEYEVGKPGIDAVELARVIDRGIRESGLVDFEKLCIKEGEKVWQIFVDIFAVNDDGNMLDAAGLAALVALGSAKLPKYNEAEGKVEPELSDKPVPLARENLSFNMTIHNIGGSLVTDVSSDEELISDYRVSVAVADNEGEPRITAMQKGKEGAISEKDMENILKLVEDKFQEMFPAIKGYVFGK